MRPSSLCPSTTLARTELITKNNLNPSNTRTQKNTTLGHVVDPPPFPGDRIGGRIQPFGDILLLRLTKIDTNPSNTRTKRTRIPVLNSQKRNSLQSTRRTTALSSNVNLPPRNQHLGLMWSSTQSLPHYQFWVHTITFWALCLHTITLWGLCGANVFTSPADDRGPETLEVNRVGRGIL